MQVEKWIEEFEEVSELLKWNELQKVIYAKKPVTRIGENIHGAAKRHQDVGHYETKNAV